MQLVGRAFFGMNTRAAAGVGCKDAADGGEEAKEPHRPALKCLTHYNYIWWRPIMPREHPRISTPIATLPPCPERVSRCVTDVTVVE